MNTPARIFAALALAGIFSSARAAISLAGSPGADDFILAASGGATAILVATNDDRAVLRAAGDLAEDIKKVSGAKPEIISEPGGKKTVVIVGTFGRSKFLDALIAEKKLDAAGVRGKWESHVTQLVSDPLPGVSRALVIAGSDRRGTIYGIYELSELIGVSPWSWWADVPVSARGTIALRGDIFKQGPPAVKYRGIFLNDEDFGLRPWASKTFEPETGNIGPKTYAKIFELLLRLRANYLWPAMHGGTAEFNHFATNKEIAEAYGIVMGSSHCEQMLRNNISEWDTNRFGEYNFVTNPDGVLKYWDERVRENGRFENIYTMGMRGIHDSGMPGGGTKEERALRLHDIIDRQREILARRVNTNVAEVPQIFCPYKEVLELYQLAPNIPDDITLVWPDDNYGYIRQFSNARERQRSGGGGVYYHVSYWGAPCDYLWLESTPPALIREEMAKAWDLGASNVWMLNVGDIKPAEIATEFFLKLAWNPHRWTAQDVNGFLVQQAARDFGAEHAAEIAAVLAEYYRLNTLRKPEHMGYDQRLAPFVRQIFAVNLNGDEVERRLAEWKILSDRADALSAKLPTDAQDAFYQLVGYPVRAAALLNEKALNLTKYFNFSANGRAVASTFYERARAAHLATQQATDKYNSLANGKWHGMMKATPHKQELYGLPSLVVLPVSHGHLVSFEVEGGGRIADGGGGMPPRLLPEFSRFTRQSHFADIFNIAENPSPWKIVPQADWIRVSQTAGTNDARVWVSVDWDKAPRGENVSGEIRVQACGDESSIRLSVFNPTNEIADADFAEENRRVVIEAEHASAFVPGKDARWEIADGLGYNGAAVGVTPVTAPVPSTPAQASASSPRLDYRVWLRTPGEWKFTVRALPTWPVAADAPGSFAIALDDTPPQIVSLPSGTPESSRIWADNVLRNAALPTVKLNVAAPGLHTLKIWMVDPGVVLDAIIGDGGCLIDSGYTWPNETRRAQIQN